MANDIDLWQDLQRQKEFIKYCKKTIKKLNKKREIENWTQTLKRAEENYKIMFNDYYKKYIIN